MKESFVNTSYAKKNDFIFSYSFSNLMTDSTRVVTFLEIMRILTAKVFNKNGIDTFIYPFQANVPFLFFSRLPSQCSFSISFIFLFPFSFPFLCLSAGYYMFKVKNRNTRTRREICSKLTIKTRS